jgi:cytochrome c-type biogenesis protein CcmF
MDISFAGEHLLPGRAGQFFIVLSFCSALLATLSYFFSTRKSEDEASWIAIGRWAVRINLLSIISAGICLFYIIYNHLFEYHYAWAHSSMDLPVHYIISCFWEGQEGSFWLWIFWQAILANVLVWRAKRWEGPVLTIIMLSQAVIASMLLGVSVFGFRIGSSPFILLREAINLKDMAPVVFADAKNYANYLSFIKDGNGLNPLLQNYWMVIHPPTLFLGFASMVVPFAYALAGLWQRRYKEWTQPVMPWALFAVMILGAGIIMGSFWAYEALNFGGFWGWDPVENASIIPWLILIAAVHVLLAYKHSGHSYFTATFLVLLSFVLVLYASFLTRSGILGDTSVHAFTDLGMFGHLVFDVALFAVLAAVFLAIRWKEMPISKKDEETYSREFWLFIGALVLVVSCIQIVGYTSIPVYNAIFHTKMAPPVDPVPVYNRIQVPIAAIIALISGFTQFLKYKNTDPRKFYISLSVSVVFSLVIAAFVVWLTGLYTNLAFIILAFSSVFTIICNGRILGEAFHGKWKLSGSAIAHIGFGMLLLGALIAASTSKVISLNSSGMIPVKDFEKSNKPGENIILYQNEPKQMDKYMVTYLNDTTIYPNTFYKVNYKLLDKDGKVKEEFNLYPNAQQNEKMGLVASPDTKHYLTFDIYTHATAAPQLDPPGEHGHDEEEAYLEPEHYEVRAGDTVKIDGGIIIVRSLMRNAPIANIPLGKDDISVGLRLNVQANGKSYEVMPVYLLKSGNQPLDFGKKVDEAGLMLRFPKINPDKDNFELMVYRKKEAEKKWIVMKAIVFPYINLFWGGTIIMVAGFLISIFRRNRELRRAH